MIYYEMHDFVNSFTWKNVVTYEHIEVNQNKSLGST